MSSLRDIRLIVVRKLDEPPAIKAAVMDVLNVLDTCLDREGYQEPEEVTAALRVLEETIIQENMEDIPFSIPDDAIEIEDIESEDDALPISYNNEEEEEEEESSPISFEEEDEEE